MIDDCLTVPLVTLFRSEPQRDSRDSAGQMKSSWYHLRVVEVWLKPFC